MSMQAASLEVLEKANVPAPQARAIVQAIEIELSASQSRLATKQDLEELGRVTKQDLEELGRITKHDLEELRGVTETLGKTTKQDLSDTRHELELKIEGLRGELGKTAEALQAKIEKSASEIVWRFLGLIVAQTSVLLTFVYFAVAHFRP